MAMLREFNSALDKSVDNLLNQYKIPGAAIVVIKDGKSYIKTFGTKKTDEKEPVTDKTAFNVASTSKAFVSTAAAILVDEGKMSWDDPIQNYVPEFTLPHSWMTQNVTIRDLCGNRTGLSRDGLNEYGANFNVPSTEIFKRLKYTKMCAGFRDKFTYVNPGHTAVGVAIGRITGMSFIDFLKQRLLKPLGMNHTSGGTVAKTDLADDMAAWHIEDRNGQTRCVKAYFSDNYLGGGGMCSSAKDAARWLFFHINQGRIDSKQLITKKNLLETHSPQIIVRPEDLAMWIGVPETKFAAYGLGWAISELDGHTVVRHSGSDLGVSAQIAFITKKGMGVAVYLNKNSTPCALEINYTILAHLLDLKQRDWQTLINDPSAPSTYYDVPRLKQAPDPDIKANFPLTTYVGDYQSLGNGTARISIKEDHLFLEFLYGKIYNCDLYPLGGNDFLPIARQAGHETNLRVRAKFLLQNNTPMKFEFPEIGTFILEQK